MGQKQSFIFTASLCLRELCPSASSSSAPFLSLPRLRGVYPIRLVSRLTRRGSSSAGVATSSYASASYWLAAPAQHHREGGRVPVLSASLPSTRLQRTCGVVFHLLLRERLPQTDTCFSSCCRPFFTDNWTCRAALQMYYLSCQISAPYLRSFHSLLSPNTP